MERAIEFVKYMVDTFGVRSCFDNIDEENSLEDEGVWYECPECGEPILYEDYPEAFEFRHYNCKCPICEFDYEEGEY